MDIFERLRQETLKAQQENDLPDFIAQRIFDIAAHPQAYRHSLATIEYLLQRLPEYDTYGQTGYLGMGVDDTIILKILQQLESEGRE